MTESSEFSATLHFESLKLSVRAGESVLDALLRQGVGVPFSCRGGVCQACLLRCTEGTVSPSAQRGLSAHLADQAYLLACQCQPAGELHLARPEPSDLRTTCQLTSLQGRGTPWLSFTFEPQRTLACRPGDHLRLVTGPDPTQHPVLVVTSDPAEGDWHIGATLHWPDPSQILPLPWLADDAPDPFGQEFEVWGPQESLRPNEPADADPAAEVPVPATDPALWHELGDGRVVRQVLDAFYAQVFVDPQLASFFEGVTPERAAGQQYAFLCQLMTGEKVYFGDRPRNAHHWMVISDTLMDYRQALMIKTLQQHGLSPAQIVRWTRFEEHFRRDMVKTEPFAKVQHGISYPLDGFDREILGSGSLCDHCGAEVPEGTEVLYHRRLGTISCPTCAPGQTGA